MHDHTPDHVPAPSAAGHRPQVQARIRELSLKTLDIADGLLDQLKAGQTAPAQPSLPVTVARRQTVSLLGVPLLCERGRCRRTKLCQGEPSHCLSACLHVLPHDAIARVLSAKAMRQRVRKLR